MITPLLKQTSIHVLLALVAANSLELEELDMKRTFLHGNLDEQIYMHQAEGFKVSGKEDHVCSLKKSLYGFRQVPRQWYQRFDAFMMKQSCTRSKYDSCVYFRKLDDDSIIYLLLYVDKMLIAAKSMSKIETLKSQLGKEFEMKDLGATVKILGMEIHG